MVVSEGSDAPDDRTVALVDESEGVKVSSECSTKASNATPTWRPKAATPEGVSMSFSSNLRRTIQLISADRAHTVAASRNAHKLSSLFDQTAVEEPSASLRRTIVCPPPTKR